MLLNPDEILLLQNRSFFDSKRIITQKIADLLGSLTLAIEQRMQKHSGLLPPTAFTTSAKISRGENYKGYPYLVLDYPRVFTADDIFAYRILTWWGHGFSFTLHLAGSSFDRHIHKAMANLPSLTNSDFKIAFSHNPWIHDPDDPSFRPVTDSLCRDESLEKKLTAQRYFKVVKPLAFPDHPHLRQAALSTIEQFFDLLSS